MTNELVTNLKIIRLTRTRGKLHYTIVTDLEIFDAGLLASHPKSQKDNSKVELQDFEEQGSESPHLVLAR